MSWVYLWVQQWYSRWDQARALRALINIWIFSPFLVVLTQTYHATVHGRGLRFFVVFRELQVSCLLTRWTRKILILKTIGNRKGDCAWSCSRWQTQPAWENLQIAMHKSVLFTPHIVLICALQFADFLMQVVFVTSNNFTHNLLFYFQ